MDDAERERRRNEIGDKVREMQAARGHAGPMPSFLDLMTDFMIDTEARLDALEKKLARISKQARSADLRTRPIG